MFSKWFIYIIGLLIAAPLACSSSQKQTKSVKQEVTGAVTRCQCESVSQKLEPAGKRIHCQGACHPQTPAKPQRQVKSRRFRSQIRRVCHPRKMARAPGNGCRGIVDYSGGPGALCRGSPTVVTKQIQQSPLTRINKKDGNSWMM